MQRGWLTVIEEEEDPTYNPTESDSEPILNVKGKAKVMWQIMEGSERCAQCVGRGLVCKIDVFAIQRWEASVAAGKELIRAPAGVRCEECRGKRPRCLLPRTNELRNQLPATEIKEKRKCIESQGNDNKVVIADAGRVKRSRVSPDSSEVQLVGILLPMLRLLKHNNSLGNEHECIADALERIADRMEEGERYHAATETSEQQSSAEESEDEIE